MRDRFIISVLSWAKRRQLLRPGDRVLAGVSGGADSMAMLEVLCWAAQSRAWRLELHVAHFDHRLRGEESRLDAEFVEQQARIKGLPFHGGSGDARLYAQTHRMNLEQSCRHLRYDFLRERAAAIGAHRIVTGHTMSDQAETFLMRLLRGAGSEGLASIRPLLDGLIARPLLGVTREEVRDFCSRRSVAFREDRTNFDPRFLRNRVRLEILPALALINPKIVPTLARTASLLADDEEYLAQAVREQLERVSFNRTASAPGGVTASQFRWPTDFLAQLPAALRRRLLREGVKAIKGNLTRVTSAHVEAIERMVIRSQSGRRVQIPGGFAVRLEFGELIAGQETEAATVLRETLEPGADRIVGSMRVRIAIEEAEKCEWEPDDKRRAVLDAEKVAMPVVLRTRKEGERYVPYGKQGAAAVKDLMVKKRIPKSSRAAHPVFASARDEFIWSPGLPTAEKFRIDAATKRVLILHCDPFESGQSR